MCITEPLCCTKKLTQYQLHLNRNIKTKGQRYRGSRGQRRDHLRTPCGGRCQWARRVCSAETKAACTLNSQPREPWENQFLFFKHPHLWQLAIDWMFFVLKINALKAIPTVLVLGGGAIGRIRSWGWNLHTWDWCPDKRNYMTPSPFHHVRTQESDPHQTLNLSAPWPWTFSASRTKRDKLPLFLSRPGSGLLWEQPGRTQPQQIDTGPHSKNFQTASLCQTPCLLQVRTCLLSSSQPCFLLPPHLSFYPSFSKELGPLLSLHTPAQPAGPKGIAHPAPGTRSFPTSVKASSWHFHLLFPTLYRNSLNLDSADLSTGICLNKSHIETGSSEARMTAGHPSLPCSVCGPSSLLAHCVPCKLKGFVQ